MPHVMPSKVVKMAISALLGAAVMVSLAVSVEAASAAKKGNTTQSEPPSKDTTTSCPDFGPLTTPFSRFGDYASYSLVPNGNLEAGKTGWSLSDATVELGNETFYVGSTSDRLSLKIIRGGTAVTPRFCVGAEHPTFRFFAYQPDAAAAGDLNVYIRYITQDGETKDQQVDTLAGSQFPAWRPSRIIDLYEKLGFSDSTATTTAQLVFRTEDERGAAWRVDDVYVDPYRR